MQRPAPSKIRANLVGVDGAQRETTHGATREARQEAWCELPQDGPGGAEPRYEIDPRLPQSNPGWNLWGLKPRWHLDQLLDQRLPEISTEILVRASKLRAVGNRTQYKVEPRYKTTEKAGPYWVSIGSDPICFCLRNAHENTLCVHLLAALMESGNDRVRAKLETCGLVRESRPHASAPNARASDERDAAERIATIATDAKRAGFRQNVAHVFASPYPIVPRLAAFLCTHPDLTSSEMERLIPSLPTMDTTFAQVIRRAPDGRFSTQAMVRAALRWPCDALLTLFPVLDREQYLAALEQLINTSFWPRDLENQLRDHPCPGGPLPMEFVTKCLLSNRPEVRDIGYFLLSVEGQLA